MVPPKLCLLVYNPINCRYITNKNHSEIGGICTNLAIVWGHHLVGHGGIFMGESSNLSGDLLSWCCGLFFKMGTDYKGTVRLGIFQPTLGFLSAIGAKYMKIWEL